jgi:hypothetical protein
MTRRSTKPPSAVRAECMPLNVPRDPRGRPKAEEAAGRQPRVRGTFDPRWTTRPNRPTSVPGVDAQRTPASSMPRSHPAAAGCRAIRTCVVGHPGKSVTPMPAKVARPAAAAASTPTSPWSPTNPSRGPSPAAGPCRTGHRAPPRHTTPSPRSVIGPRSRTTSPRPADRARPQPIPGSTTSKRPAPA